MPSQFLTIASVGVTPTPSNVFIVKETEPEYRDNGGDLQEGDRWFHKSSRVESVYVDGHWLAFSSTLPK